MADLTPEQAENLNPARFRVLFVEDESVVADFVREQLESLKGMNIVFTENGEDAIRILEKEKQLGRPFDLVILDWHLGKGMDGIQTSIEIKKEHLGLRTFLWSLDDEELKSLVSENQRQELGIGEILSKKLDINNLPAIIGSEQIRQIFEKTQP